MLLWQLLHSVCHLAKRLAPRGACWKCPRQPTAGPLHRKEHSSLTDDSAFCQGYPACRSVPRKPKYFPRPARRFGMKNEETLDLLKKSKGTYPIQLEVNFTVWLMVFMSKLAASFWLLFLFVLFLAWEKVGQLTTSESWKYMYILF